MSFNSGRGLVGEAEGDGEGGGSMHTFVLGDRFKGKGEKGKTSSIKITEFS